jgi:CheY-like chemotaxis protein
MITKDQFLLYIEDNAIHRHLAKTAITQKQFSNLLLPSSIVECQQMISSNNNIYRALVDYNLDEWVGENYATPIVLGTKVRIDGIEVAEYVNEISPGINIELFSSSAKDLQDKVDKRNISPNINVLKKQPGTKHLYDYWPSYIDSLFQQTLKIRPLHKPDTHLPIEIKIFFAKRLLTPYNQGSTLWKVGQFIWQVGIDEDLQIWDSDQLAYNKNLIADNPLQEYYARFTQDNNFHVEQLHIYQENIDITRNNVINDEIQHHGVLENKSSIERITTDLILAQYISNQYLTKQIDVHEAINRLKKLCPAVQFDSQKTIFKQLSANNESVKQIEDIYKLMNYFHIADFPKIINIYSARVDSIEGHTAYVKFESLAPGKKIHKQPFKSELLASLGMVKNSRFEYTVFAPVGGGSASHIEPK